MKAYFSKQPHQLSNYLAIKQKCQQLSDAFAQEKHERTSQSTLISKHITDKQNLISNSENQRAKIISQCLAQGVAKTQELGQLITANQQTKQKYLENKQLELNFTLPKQEKTNKRVVQKMRGETNKKINTYQYQISAHHTEANCKLNIKINQITQAKQTIHQRLNKSKEQYQASLDQLFQEMVHQIEQIDEFITQQKQSARNLSAQINKGLQDMEDQINQLYKEEEIQGQIMYDSILSLIQTMVEGVSHHNFLI